jgi:hypothetical protein
VVERTRRGEQPLASLRPLGLTGRRAKQLVLDRGANQLRLARAALLRREL